MLRGLHCLFVLVGRNNTDTPSSHVTIITLLEDYFFNKSCFKIMQIFLLHNGMLFIICFV